MCAHTICKGLDTNIHQPAKCGSTFIMADGFIKLPAKLPGAGSNSDTTAKA